jgi:predicted transglutaminase-like cysteine proteinase
VDFKVANYQTRAEKTRATLALIEGKIYRGSTNPKIYQLSRAVVRGLPEHDHAAEIVALSREVKRRVRFTRDPYRAEAVQDAGDTLTLGTGDCDDYAVLLGAMLQSVGIPMKLEAVGMGENFDHVFLTGRDNAGVYVPLDLSRPDGKYFSSQPAWNVRRSFPLRPPAAAAKRQLRDAVKRKKADGSGRKKFIKDFIASSVRAGKIKNLSDYNAAMRRAENHWNQAKGARVAAPSLAALTGTDGGLGSWLSETVNQVVGKKRGREIEKKVNKATKNLWDNTKANFRAVAPVVEKIPLIGDAWAAGGAVLNVIDPVTGQAMAAPTGYKGIYGAAPAPAPMPAPAPAPAPKNNNTLLLIGGAVALAVILGKKR